jgi:hypothetical protein
MSPEEIEWEEDRLDRFRNYKRTHHSLRKKEYENSA